MKTHNQYGLLKEARYFPFFMTQFLGAFNDNVYKNAIIIFITFHYANAIVLTNVSAGLFILPFFLFSALAGQLADKYEKSQLIRKIKGVEVIIMGLAGLAFYYANIEAMIFILFLMGFQSACFGPVKYGILPQLITSKELMGGNGLISMGTFVAILTGTLLGGMMIQYEMSQVMGIILITIALCGWLSSLWIPSVPITTQDLQMDWNPFRQSVKIMRLIHQDNTVFHSILGISWFYFTGFAYLTLLPNYCKMDLHADPGVVTLILTLFSLGIGMGSLLCERLSSRTIELGLVPFGSFGLSLFSIDMYFALPDVSALSGNDALLNVSQFLQLPSAIHLLIDIVMIGLFGGLYVVPLQAIIQIRCDPKARARIISGNNIMNAIFMVLMTIYATIALKSGLTLPELFLSIALMNIVVAFYIFTLVPEFFMRFLVWGIVHMVYRVKKEGLENIPDTGAVVLICNHVSFVDALVIAVSVKRPVRFVMDHHIFKIPIIHYIFRISEAIPIASAREDKAILLKAYDEISTKLDNGEVLCIFPEGVITKTGDINSFKGGLAKIIKRNPVPVIPMALQGLWGSFFSRKHGPAMSTWPRRFWSKIALRVGEMVPAERVNPIEMQKAVETLRGQET